MDKRSWPWKKKSSDKLPAERLQGKMDNNYKKPMYAQISMESYTQLTGLEDQVSSYEEQVQSLEDEVKQLNRELSEAHLEIINKENLVKQHIKVAEEAVSGWEKADAEFASMKNHLEAVTLLKLAAEDRAARLDGALKECMMQIGDLKEDHELKLQEVILSKTNIFDKMKFELEKQINNFEEQLLRAAAENAALSRSLQELSNTLMNLSEEKSQADAEIEILKSNIESREKEVNSLKYECHMARKEVEIRNEEKNMCLQSAEAAIKHHLDGLKKIAKLEAECQRLRILVQKKLPGPAALAQMKREVENMGLDYTKSQGCRYTKRPPIGYMPQMPQRENELLKERLIAMDEEASLLKEALAKRNSELQTCRSIYAHTVRKLHSLESQLQVNGEWRSHLSNDPVPIEGLPSQKACSSPSSASMSEFINDDLLSCAGLYATVSMSDRSNIQKDRNGDTRCKSQNNNCLDLMDDFLEMEKLAHQSRGLHDTISSSDVSGDSGSTVPELLRHVVSVEGHTCTESPSASEFQIPSTEDSVVADPQLQTDQLFLLKLMSEISGAIESISEEKDMEKVIMDVRHIMKDMLDTSRPQLENDGAAHGIGTVSDFDVVQITSPNVITFAGDANSCVGNTKNQELETSTSDCIDKISLQESKVVVDPSGVMYQTGCSHFSDSISHPDT